MATDQREVCPDCGEAVLPVVYGYPDQELFEESRRGEVYIGGCIVTDDDVIETCRCGAIVRRRSEVPEEA